MGTTNTKENRPLLDTDGQIDHLINKGVKFEYFDVEHAKAYLRKSNNYFKLRAYRKNFKKHPGGIQSGQYIDLDFGMLVDLAIIDMRMRYTFIHLALDIEHYAKVKLLKLIETQESDGYQIVLDYYDYLNKVEMDHVSDAKPYKPHSALMRELERNTDSHYCGGIAQNYNGRYPVWVFVEILSFGGFISFYAFCASRFSSRYLKDDSYLLKEVKKIRNAAAHNNCIIYDMTTSDTGSLNYDVARSIPTNIISSSTRKAKEKNVRMRQIITLLYSHQHFVSSDGVLLHTKIVLSDLVERMNTNISYYKGNDTITSTFGFIGKLVDIYYK